MNKEWGICALYTNFDANERSKQMNEQKHVASQKENTNIICTYRIQFALRMIMLTVLCTEITLIDFLFPIHSLAALFVSCVYKKI